MFLCDETHKNEQKPNIFSNYLPCVHKKSKKVVKNTKKVKKTLKNLLTFLKGVW